MRLPLENLVGPAEGDRVRRGRKPRVNETVLSEEDQERIRKLIQGRNLLPSGPKFRKLRLNIGCRIWNIRNPNYRPNPINVSASKRKWLENNPQKRKEVALAYYYRHRPPPKIRRLSSTRLAKYIRKRREENVQFAIASRMRSTINRAFRRQWIRKPEKTEILLGCSIEEAKAHIESQFVNGMCWSNRRSFVIDHVVPVVAFDLTIREEYLLAFNWKNIQPLYPHDNATKSRKLPVPLPDWLPDHIAKRITSRQPAHPPDEPSEASDAFHPEMEHPRCA